MRVYGRRPTRQLNVELQYIWNRGNAMTPEQELIGGLKIAGTASLFICMVLAAMALSGQIPL
jgi:hypothetical protein